MVRKLVTTSLIFLAVFGCFAECEGAGFFGPDPKEAPSVFRYGLRGFGIGTLLGASTGYLIGHSDNHWNTDDWRNLGISLGVGAIAGTLGGIGVGFYDLSLEQPGVGSIVMRDTLWGTGLGALVGGVAGALFIIDSGNGRDAALGASIGSLVGAAAGVVIGFIEGPKIVERYSQNPRAYYAENAGIDMPEWSFGFRVKREKNNGHAYVPMLTKRF